MYIRLDCVDWLLAYAADEHHFQGIVRGPPLELPGTAVADHRVEWEFNEHVWVCEVLVGLAAGQTMSFNPEDLLKSQWDKLRDKSLVDGFFRKSTTFTRKKAAKELVKLWCAATQHGERQAMETTWMSHAQALPDVGDAEPQPKRRRCLSEWAVTAVADAEGNTNPSAVADFQPAVAEASPQSRTRWSQNL